MEQETKTFPIPTKESFQNVREIYINDFIDNATSNEGWVHSKDKDNVKIETKKKPGTDMLCCRGKGKINAPPEEVYKEVCDPALQRKLDKYLRTRNDVERFSDDDVIVYYQYASPGPIDDRDFVMYEANFKKDKFFVSLAKSVPREDVPVAPKHVRGEVMSSGYYVEAIDGEPNACVLTYIVQVDMKGLIPKFLVNMSSVDQPLLVKEIRQICEQKWKSKQTSQN